MADGFVDVEHLELKRLEFALYVAQALDRRVPISINHGKLLLQGPGAGLGGRRQRLGVANLLLFLSLRALRGFDLLFGY